MARVTRTPEAAKAMGWNMSRAALSPNNPGNGPLASVSAIHDATDATDATESPIRPRLHKHVDAADQGRCLLNGRFGDASV
ncbi:hypothetical protein E4U54_003958 [Claviceps lovelessii]|nr:hypothetical protein E4U54_003958 [Claviceps lovelessii]